MEKHSHTEPSNGQVTEVPDVGRIGIWSAGFDLLSPTELTDTVSELDGMGFGTLWFGEAYGREAFTQAQLLLGASHRMVVATGIANIWARDAVACNAAARTLDTAYPGRFLLGLGVSHQPLVQRMRGHGYSKPLTAMRDYLTAMDSAPYVAWKADAPRPPRVLAALAPGMLTAARDQADGANPYLTLPEHTALAREAIGPLKLLAPEVSCVLTDDYEVWHQRAHTHLSLYTGLPNYVNNWKRFGFTDEDSVRGGSDRLKKALVCRGVEATLAKVREHHDAGADHVCIQVLGETPFSKTMNGWRQLAEGIA
jgi:probable F420-dependent oxidoreductase